MLFSPSILDFGPRGRSPIEKDKLLDADNLLRFALSGALCSSAVHLALTPLDVVKTNLQTNPIKYPGPISAFKTLLSEVGPKGFYAGWIPTFVGFFLYGGISYASTEFFRREFTDLLGATASSFEVPVILAAGVSDRCVYIRM
jgi:solute carrier family 25 phosphate transporter 3